MMTIKLLSFIFVTLFYSCTKVPVSIEPNTKTMALIEKSRALQLRGDKVEESLLKKKDSIEVLEVGKMGQSKGEGFINILEMSDDFVLDMRYATSNNFLKEKVYDCAQCYVRKEVANALIGANKDLIKKGYKIKLFDCYRPYSVQKKMWKIFPNPGYVADPKGGSIHNKGAAVDITLVKMDGSPVDMGTDFDHFGKEAHHAYSKLSKDVIGHRKLLRETMKAHGFSTIRTEWWHYNFKSTIRYRISDFRWKCG